MNRAQRRKLAQVAGKIQAVHHRAGIIPSVVSPLDMVKASMLPVGDAATQRLHLQPSAVWTELSTGVRQALGQVYGVYCLPSRELVTWLRTRIAGRSAIEIGAGSGYLSAALGIPGTDSFVREGSEEPIPYGPHVERLEASEAVERYKPRVVLASWVTFRFVATAEEGKAFPSGSPYGPRFDRVLRSVDEVILVGNRLIHGRQDGMQLRYRPQWRGKMGIVHSRSQRPDLDGIWTWQSRFVK